MSELIITVCIFLIDLAAGVLLSSHIFKGRTKDLLPLAFSVLIILAGGALLRLPLYALLVSSSFAMLASILAIRYYYSTLGFALLLLAIAVEAYALFILAVPSLYLFLSGFAIGTASGLVYLEKVRLHVQNIRSKSRTEITRDIVQILLGAVVLLVIILFKAEGVIGIALLGIAAYAFVSLISTRQHSLALRKSKVYHIMMSFERKGTVYGLGAVYMLAGYLLLAGLVVNYSYLLFGLAALLICDPVATITGRGLGKRSHSLPYNSSKSIEGSLAFFAVALVFGYVLLQSIIIAALFSALLAFLEGAKLHINDNISIPAVVAVLYALNLLL